MPRFDDCIISARKRFHPDDLEDNAPLLSNEDGEEPKIDDMSGFQKSKLIFMLIGFSLFTLFSLFCSVCWFVWGMYAPFLFVKVKSTSFFVQDSPLTWVNVNLTTLTL